MKNIIKKLLILLLAICVFLNVFSSYEANVNADGEIEYIKISVDDYYGHENNYLKTENKRYIICGIIDGIYLSFPEQGIHGFQLRSFNPLFTNSVTVYCQVDAVIQNFQTTYNNHFVYNGNLSNSSGKGKYIEVLLDEDAFTETIADSSKARGYVYCDAVNPNIDSDEDFYSYINSYKSNEAKSSMRFDYDLINTNSESSTTTWTLVTDKSQITDDGIYTFGKLYDDGKSIRFAVEPKNYKSGDKFDYSIARIEDNSFTIVYPDAFPAEFKIISKDPNPYYDVKFKSNLFNECAVYNNNCSGETWLSTSYGNIVNIDDDTEDVTLYLFKKTNSGSARNTYIEYDPQSISIMFLSYIDSETNDNIANSHSLINKISYGMKLSIEGKDDQFIDFDSSEIARVDSFGSNTAVLEGGVLQSVLKLQGIPMENWNTNISITPYIKITFDSYTVPSTEDKTFDIPATYIYQEEITRTVSSLAEYYYLNLGTDPSVSGHLIALKEIAESTAKVREAK